ncbi:hypothetical protein ACFQ0M_23250 [Kitasatospora aburaviensis]
MVDRLAELRPQAVRRRDVRAARHRLRDRRRRAGLGDRQGRRRAGPAPPANPYAPAAEQRPSAADLDTVRTLDRRTGWGTVPLAATALVALTLVNNVFAALGSDWLRAHQTTFAALGAAALFAVSAVRVYLQQLPGGPVAVAPHSPLQGLRAPTDSTPGPALRKGRTGSAPTSPSRSPPGTPRWRASPRSRC